MPGGEFVDRRPKEARIVFGQQDVFHFKIHLCLGREGKRKRRPAICGTFRPNPASVTKNDPPDAGQSDARALELHAAMQALKHAEEFVGVFRIETDAIVPNESYCFTAAIGNAADFNFAATLGFGGLQTGGRLFLGVSVIAV